MTDETAPDISELEAAMTQPAPDPVTPPPPGPGTPPSGTGQAVPPPPAAPASPTKFCHACGQSIDARAEICPKCGVRQPHLPGMPGAGISINSSGATTQSGKSKLAASLMAVFLGGLGVHKFYLGEVGMGVLYLIFFWTFIPSIVGFVEGIVWLTQSDEQWLAKYGNR